MQVSHASKNIPAGASVPPNSSQERASGSKILGGMFGLEETQGDHPANAAFLAQPSEFFVNARSAIFRVVEKLSPRRVWLPSFLCGSILEAVVAANAASCFYEIDDNLKVASLAWIEDVGEGDIVLLIDYFGFPFDRTLLPRIKDKGAWALEDACQALLSQGVGEGSDFVVFSPRKFVGVPDGGVLRCSVELDLAQPFSRPAPAWWLKALSASLGRREFDRVGGNRQWYALFQQVEEEQPIGHYTMSELSQAVLSSCVNYASVAASRVANYQLLYDRLKRFSLTGALRPGVVPLGFPIRVSNRDHVRESLFAKGIYPPVHWPLDGIVPDTFAGSHRLANRIMTLPCDQRDDAADMERMAHIVLQEAVP